MASASDRNGVERLLRGLGWEERFIAGQLGAVDRLSELPTAAVFVEDDANSEAARAFYVSRGYSADYVMSRYYADDVDGVTYVRFFAS